MRTFRRICVYCGSKPGDDPLFVDAARKVGRALAEHGIGVVFGGGRVGLMGALADAALAAGGDVFGVIPHKLQEAEIAHGRLTELFVVDSMHARKMVMAQLADGFIALPGGFGTLDELFEITTWNQLGYHHKPVGLLNVGGFFDLLLRFLDHAAQRGFVRPDHRAILHAAPDLSELLGVMAQAAFPAPGRPEGPPP